MSQHYSTHAAMGLFDTSFYSDSFIKEIVLKHYGNVPNGAEYNNRGQRTHLWRKLGGTGKRITILMHSPSTATGRTNDRTVTCLMNRLKEVTDYSSMSLISRLFNTDVLIAWGSAFRITNDANTIRKTLTEKYSKTKIFEFDKFNSNTVELSANILSKNTPLRVWGNTGTPLNK